MKTTITKTILLVASFGFSLFLFASHALAYTSVNIPATIRDNGRDFQATIVATLQSSTQPQEGEGSQPSNAGFNLYIGGITTNITDTTQPLAPSLIFDFSFPISPTVNGLVEMFNFANIDAITISGVTYIPSQIIAQNPSFQNVVLAALIAPPPGLTAYNNLYSGASEFRGVEAMSAASLSFPTSPQASFSKVETVDIDNNGSAKEIIFYTAVSSSSNVIHAFELDGTEHAGFPVTISATPLPVSASIPLDFSVGDIDGDLQKEIVVRMSLTIFIIQSDGTVSASIANDGITNPPGASPNTVFGQPPPILADVNGDTIPDIIIVNLLSPAGNPNGPPLGFYINAIDGTGMNVPGFPDTQAYTFNPPLIPGPNFDFQGHVAAGNVDADSATEVVFPYIRGGQFNVVIYDTVTHTANVSTLNFSVPLNGTAGINFPTLLMNIDADSAQEIITGFSTVNVILTTSPRLVAIKGNGNIVPGWNQTPLPNTALLLIYEIAGGDIDGDGINDVGIFSQGTTPYFLNAAGGFINGFPSSLIAYNSAYSGRIADIDLNGFQDALIIENSGGVRQLAAYTTGGSQITGYGLPVPLPFPSQVNLNWFDLIFDDLDGDGVGEAVVLGSNLSTNTNVAAVFKVARYNGSNFSAPYGNLWVNSENTNAQ